MTSKEHAAAIAAKMTADPTTYRLVEVRDCGAYGDYDGNGGDLPTVPRDDDAGRCACGATIRWAYIIQSTETGHWLTIGSTCIKVAIPYLRGIGCDELADTLSSAAKDQAAKARAIRNDALRAKMAEYSDLYRAWVRTANRLYQEEAAHRKTDAVERHIINALLMMTPDHDRLPTAAWRRTFVARLTRYATEYTYSWLTGAGPVPFPTV